MSFSHKNRYCFVPTCKNTSFKTPSKIFVQVPKARQYEWCIIVGRDDAHLRSPKTTFYCCEDHFNIQKDAENWLEYIMMERRVKFRIKKSAIPRFNITKQSQSVLLSESVPSTTTSDETGRLNAPLVAISKNYLTSTITSMDTTSAGGNLITNSQLSKVVIPQLSLRPSKKRYIVTEQCSLLKKTRDVAIQVKPQVCDKKTYINDMLITKNSLDTSSSTVNSVESRKLLPILFPAGYNNVQ